MKYQSPNTDLAALQRELGGRADPDSDEYDDYLDGSDDDESDDTASESEDGGDWAVRRRR